MLLSASGRSICIDSGPGTLRALLSHGVTYMDIDVICYTHLHCDHISELGPILFAMRNMSRPRRKDCLIIGPPGLSAHYQRLLDLYDGTLDPAGYNVLIKEMREGEMRRPEATIRTIPMEHTASSIGYRFEAGGRSFSFSGDTGYCPAAVELGRGCGLLALECSFPDGMEVEGHLTPRLAGRIAAAAVCRRLLLTHFYPACDGVDVVGQCRAEFSGEIIQAADGMKLRID